MPTAIELKTAIRERLDAMRWPDSSRVFPALSIVEAPIPPPTDMQLPIAWIAERSERFDADNPFQADITVAVTIYQQDLRDRTGEAAIRGDGADAGAATSRGLDQITRRVGEQIGYLGPTYAIRNVQTTWGATQIREGEWIVYRELSFTATVSTDASFGIRGTVYSTGTLTLVDSLANSYPLGEVSNLELSISEMDLRSDGEDEGGGWSLIQQGAFKVQVDCEMRGWDSTANSIFEGIANANAGLDKTSYTATYTPRDGDGDSITFVLQNCKVFRPRLRARFAPTREMVRAFSLVATSENVASMLTWGTVTEVGS